MVRVPEEAAVFVVGGTVSNPVVGDVRGMTRWSAYVANASDECTAVLAQLVTTSAIAGTDRPHYLWSPAVMNQGVWPPRSILPIRRQQWSDDTDQDLLTGVPVAGHLSNSAVFINAALG